jgi:hypothetical protein
LINPWCKALSEEIFLACLNKNGSKAARVEKCRVMQKIDECEYLCSKGGSARNICFPRDIAFKSALMRFSAFKHFSVIA